jgi:predicted RNase H-like HicB family nuclease
MEQYPEAGWLERGANVVKYTVIIERTDNNFAAYVPDLPGCIATGKTREETETNIRSAIAMHIEGLREDNVPVPIPSTDTLLVEV